jgi:hypothetical protein
MDRDYRPALQLETAPGGSPMKKFRPSGLFVWILLGTIVLIGTALILFALDVVRNMLGLGRWHP